MILLNNFEEEKEISQDYYEIFLKLLAPFAPLIVEELWHQTGRKNSIHFESWPKYDVAKLKKEIFELVIQINGKVKDKIEVSVETNEEELKKIALSRPKIKNILGDKTTLRIVVVPRRLVNIVV
jgi:leucyl-tRNA synthetase